LLLLGAAEHDLFKSARYMNAGALSSILAAKKKAVWSLAGAGAGP